MNGVGDGYRAEVFWGRLAVFLFNEVDETRKEVV